jgi:ERCC4-type nuclease
MEQLAMKVIILEGRNNWTRDGESTLVNGWSETQQTGIIFSLHLKNFLVLETQDHQHTSRSISQLQKYLSKSNHSSLERRPKAVGSWGKADSKEFAIHVLQSFPGVGVDLARRIYDRFGLPLRWTVDILELQQLDGIGPKKAAQIMGALNDTTKP